MSAVIAAGIVLGVIVYGLWLFMALVIEGFRKRH